MHLVTTHWIPKLVLAALLVGMTHVAHAQDEAPVEESAQDLDQIEAEIEKGAPPEKPAKPAAAETQATPDPQTLSDLGRLAPFSEVTVLQRRFQPKTERFQASFGLGGITNDPWFYGVGGSLRFAYHFSEAFALEGVATFLSNSERDSAKDLLANNAVSTSSIVSTKGFYGVDLMWSPIYGKMSLFNKRIIPFDMYFSGGLGQSEVDGATSKNLMTFHVGTGQVFALSKSWGFRWDFSWNTYAAKQVDTAGKESTTQFNNLILTLGASYFFPEVKYR
ncbi:MAG: outer membrane beta-barrel domain-containing protein [Bdellovibrionaceae bacterium]|nr:outer membrane beta-barrel domain-containing protein [Pseudobdellovibrionaceae bacterium]